MMSTTHHVVLCGGFVPVSQSRVTAEPGVPVLIPVSKGP